MQRNQPLADFLRSRRARILPAAGEPPRRRRTAGLKREEVAQAAGISVEWYVKLEQGRGAGPSAETLTALARALRLDPVETAHLRLLARRPSRPVFAREVVPTDLAALVASLKEPAYVTGQRWDVLAWNNAAKTLITDFASMPEGTRNILSFVLTDPHARVLFGADWASEARRMVSRFRLNYDAWAGDPAFECLVNGLRAGCPEFDPWWSRHDVDAPSSGLKELWTARGGTRRFRYSSFQSNDDPGLKLALYVPVP